MPRSRRASDSFGSERDAGEEVLVARAREGDGDAFEALVRRYFARVHAFLFRLVGNHEDAEDLAQECFVRCHRALGWLRGEGAFSTWVYRIALHLSRDHMRATGRRRRAVELASNEAREREAEPVRAELRGAAGRGPSDEASRREFLAGLEGALERLPHRLRAAFVLRTFEDLSYEDVGRVLGITSGTARVHVMKARRLLSRWMEPWIGRRRP